MKKKTGKAVLVRMTEKLHKSLRIQAAELGITLTALINSVLEKGVRK